MSAWQRVKIGLVAYQLKPTKKYRVKWGWKRRVSTRERWYAAQDWAVEHEPQINYDQIRPFDEVLVLEKQLPMTLDCSAFVINLARAAGVPDPSGNNYNGTGDTAAIRRHLPHCGLADADVIVYGRPNNHPGQHVVAVRRKGHNPQTTSHGQERGPLRVSHSAEVQAHDGYYTAHKLVGLVG